MIIGDGFSEIASRSTQKIVEVWRWGSATMSALEKAFRALPDCNIGGTFPQDKKHQVQRARCNVSTAPFLVLTQPCFNRCKNHPLVLVETACSEIRLQQPFPAFAVISFRNGAMGLGWKAWCTWHPATSREWDIWMLLVSSAPGASQKKTADGADLAGVTFPFQIGISTQNPWFLQTSQAKLCMRTSWWDESVPACTQKECPQGWCESRMFLDAHPAEKLLVVLAQVSPVFPTSTETGLANIVYRKRKRSIKHMTNGFTNIQHSQCNQNLVKTLPHWIYLVLNSICASLGLWMHRFWWMASSSSGKYDGVIKSGLKLKGGDKNKEVGVKVAKKKKKTQEDVLTEELQANAEQESQEQAELQKGAAQGPTTAQKTFQLAREKRGNQRINEAIKYTHRQRMDKLNAHLGSLSEHFDIPKVGPGWDLQGLLGQAACSLVATMMQSWGVLHMACTGCWLETLARWKKVGKLRLVKLGEFHSHVVSIKLYRYIYIRSFFPFLVSLGLDWMLGCAKEALEGWKGSLDRGYFIEGHLKAE